MEKFGFIFHPLDIGLYADGFNEPDIKKKRSALVEQVMTWLPPFKRSTVLGIKSVTGAEIEGDMILVNLLPEQILTLDDKFVLKKIIEAGRIAEQLGDKIVGLGAYASHVGRKGALIARNLKIPVTTGSAYTVAISIEALLKAAALLEMDISDTEIAIIGATGSIGSICSKILSSYNPRTINIVARHKDKLEKLKKDIIKDNPNLTVNAEPNIYKAIKTADLIITTTSTPMALIDMRIVKPGSIICDISRPKNVPSQAALCREDVLVIEGGIVKPPGPVDFKFSFGLPPGLAYACMAETMILTLEKRYESYSIGGDISLEKVKEISQLGVKHGFVLADLRSFETKVSKVQIDKVKLAGNSKHLNR
jgi:fatty aldehyde-generating acyl-ACP reductase